ncbi:glyoxalase/bleomycin resistance protein/dioxygenase superfamily protein [Streptococcus varani]|uniref:Glyoxalase/bleomycin resistance protein/dioxygenase superfamily protein n=1 Tax=Streptococcus varani TaxID=1608583 RepID=A0A0E4CT14_9STRE|nr:VOC family protein [Streptococcus varani]CQR25250.1 glyoxalase/bleomycin resistance protein/dioxygenase superfamily protein [Streptococcus varani]
MQTIIPHLWFDREALEAAQLYTSPFPDSHMDWTHDLTDTPSGDAVLVQFQLANLTLAAISAGPYFKLNESTSLMVHFQNKDELDRIFETLSEAGRVLMPLGEYPFNSYYVWLEDQFGLSWQFFYSPENSRAVQLEICLLFSQEQVGQVRSFLEKAQALFPNSQIGTVNHYQENEKQEAKAQINYGELLLNQQRLVVMENGFGGENSFNEAFSLMVYTDSQEETQRLYQQLSHVPESEQCGWVKDEFGISWQIVPRPLMDAYQILSKEEMKPVHDAILTMKRLNYDEIKELVKKKG